MSDCAHIWVEVGRHFNPSRVTQLDLSRGALSEAMTKGLIYGETAVELRCERCGDVAGRSIVGNATRRGGT